MRHPSPVTGNWQPAAGNQQLALYTGEVHPDWKAAASTGDTARLQELLESGADINARDDHGQTAVMIAARDGRTPTVRFLIEKGADLNATAKFNLSALMLAVINGRDAIVGILADAGADRGIRGTGAPGFDGKTALDIAVAGQRTIMVALLQQPDSATSATRH
ncbi:MAG: ankyrin repeat domain-containing protein [Vicinamibacterales bacterium]